MSFAALGIRTLALFTLGAMLMALGTVKRPAAVRRERVLKFVVYFALVHLVILLCAVGGAAPVALVGLIAGVSAWEAGRAWRRIQRPRPWTLALVAVAIAFTAVVAAGALEPRVIAWIFLVTAACDGFSQVIGQWLGRRALAPAISPNKTIEGLIGGMLGAVLVAIWLSSLTPFAPAGATAIGAFTALAALAGDLTGSWVKRRADIKDFSRLLPGQGGVLDRFNSLLAALGTVGLWIVLS